MLVLIYKMIGSLFYKLWNNIMLWFGIVFLERNVIWVCFFYFIGDILKKVKRVIEKVIYFE